MVCRLKAHQRRLCIVGTCSEVCGAGVFNQRVNVEAVAVGVGLGEFSAQDAGVFVGDQRGRDKSGGAEAVGEIPAEVPEHRGVVGMKLRLCWRGGLAVDERNLQVHSPTRSDHSEQFSQGKVGIRHVFKYVGGQHYIDGRVREVDLLEVELDVAAVGAQIKIARAV